MRLGVPRFLFFSFLVLTGSVSLQAQNIQTPAQFLGYNLGERFTPHAQIVRYVEYLASQAPKRMQVQTYGHTYEGRPLLLATLSSEENFNRREVIRTDNLKRIGLLPGQATGKQPVIVWLSYNVHGNEAVSSEAVMQVLYNLVTSSTPEITKWLQNTLVLVDPCVNPDGRDRYAMWYNQVANQLPNVSPLAREHQEPWPGGRTNHYLFDLNRDWAWQTQQETQQRIVMYNQWMPQVHADFHEMGVEAPYYFSPAAKPFHEAITPWQRQFQQIIGENNRKYFDKNNWLYFTRETYDLFYPSYGDTWPTFNGAIAMTYEQGGGGRGGRAIVKADGDTLTLAQRIAHHYAASLATIEAASDHQEQVLQEYQKYYQQARTNPTGAYKTYVLKAGNQPGKVRQLTTYLDRQQIKYGYASQNSSGFGFNYTTGKSEAVKIELNDLVVSMYQPKSTLLKVLFDPNTKLEDSLTYDITSWAIPYAYGLPAYGLKSRVTNTSENPIPAGVKASSATVTTGAPYAYLARYNSLTDLKFLAALLNKNVKVRFSEKAFEAGGQQYAPGTLIITRTGNERLNTKFDALIKAHADSFGVQLTPSPTGFVSSGVDFGSTSVRSVRRAKIGLLAGEGISSTAFGEVWHFFEQQIHYPVTVISTETFNRVPWQQLDVLILPDGRYNDIFDEKGLTQLKDWVRAGGKVIALEGAAAHLAGKRDFTLTKRKISDSIDLKKDPYRALKRYGDAERTALSELVQGGIYRLTLDNSHPLAFGYGPTYFALIQEVNDYPFMQQGWNVGVLKKDIYATGFAGSKVKKRLQDSLVFGTQEMGRGQIVYLANNPLFRAFWHSGKLMFGNAIFMVGQ
ncbi:zinc carboxypeptidase [Adhaeribacter arboris]|uniref:Zinc carboxypeptidase n=1 Tax=Adhaeribacter arboris TaxID=2072846 RepID=A0A2T2Y947_9BACT|nr:M14 metallopeptidase family protein [Adhaeribacter arboris]PSR52049.1 zinc carboxypeptidase [Adhaeribacter arboris]